MPFDEDQTMPPQRDDEPDETKALGDEEGPSRVPSIPHTSKGETVRGSSDSGSSASSSAHTRGSSMDKRQRDVEPGHVFGDRFEVVKLLGKGGMGQVFLVLDRQIEKRKVALKLIRTRFSQNAKYGEMFFREVRTAQGFVSEHVVQVRDCGRLSDGQLFLTMDYVDGESLVTLMRRERTLAARHALEIVRQILLGIGSGHEKGFIHRDVKPQNIMLSGQKPKTEGNPYGVDASILDFGIGGLLEEVEKEPGAGSAPYFSPEQSRGERLDARSDLFAVGILLYEMIVGERPFKGRTAVEIGSSLQETNLVPLIEKLTGVPKPIKRILRKALQKEREKRYQSAGDFIKAIESSEAFRGGESGSGWMSAAALLLAASTIGLGVVATSQQAEIGDLKQSATSSESFSDTSASFRAAQVSLTNDLQTKDNQLLAKDKTIGERDARILELDGAVDAAENERNKSNDDLHDQGIAFNAEKLELDAERQNLKFLNSKLQTYIGSLYSRDSEYRRIQDTKLAAADEFPRLLDDISNGSFRGSENSLNPQHMRSWIHSRAYLDQLLKLAGSLSGNGTGATTPAMIPGLRRGLDALRGAGLESFAREARDDSETRWLGIVRRTPAQITTEIRARVQEHIGQAQEAARQQRSESGDAPVSEVSEAAADEQESQTAERVQAWDVPRNEVWDTALMGQRWESARAQASLESLAKVLELLDGRLAEVSMRFEEESNAEKARLLSVVGNRPRLLLKYIDDHGAGAQGDLKELVVKLVDTLEGTFIGSGGEAGIVGIRSLPDGLLELTERMHMPLDGGAFKLSDSLEPDLWHRLCWLAIARDWYKVGEHDKGLLTSSWWKAASRGDLAQALVSGRDRGWRATLLFQMEASKDSNFFPAQMNGLAVYRLSTPADDGALVTTTWEAERCREADSDTGKSRVVQRELGPKGEFSERNSASRAPEFHRTETGVRRTTGSRQQNLVYFHDLNHGEDGIEYWNPDPATAGEFEGVRKLPSGLRGMSGQILSELIPPDEPEGYRCLVSKGTRGKVFWVHPVLGVVREESRDSDGQITKVRELAHLER